MHFQQSKEINDERQNIPIQHCIVIESFPYYRQGRAHFFCIIEINTFTCSRRGVLPWFTKNNNCKFKSNNTQNKQLLS